MKMDDLISRAALLNDLSYCAPELWQDEEYVKAKIMKQHAVDAAPVVHGRWERVGSDGIVCCSICGIPMNKTRISLPDGGSSYCYIGTNYCPHCGAKMDGEVDA